jgi:hypothetical protein
MDKPELKCNIYLRFISIIRIYQYHDNLIVSGIYYHLLVSLNRNVPGKREHSRIVNINKILKV